MSDNHHHYVEYEHEGGNCKTLIPDLIQSRMGRVAFISPTSWAMLEYMEYLGTYMYPRRIRVPRQNPLNVGGGEQTKEGGESNDKNRED